ncbi:YceI family protein [Solemya velesiana gill symbiont]|uniref:Lipid/polyisoprenoid-binding YceI-like domain-containing protein n=1 Tax=Solemya velesiana gill symbiont TaxID=1918948 RepID=A0A1T2KY63_9GAMM|nr:YceI family protein [Solemya velesiana gill symbiont]OOZ37772.1 hypothetical protein BOW51_00455 [Solemya velesiana gill symbiont]
MDMQKQLMNAFVLFVALLGTTGGSFAESSRPCAPFIENSLIDQTLVSTMLGAAESGHLYRLQPTFSSFGFVIDSIIGPIEAEFTSFQGGISLQPSIDTGDGPALVRIEAESLHTRGFFVRGLLKSSTFFDVKNCPDVYFASKSLQRINPDEGLLAGDLTLRGITRPVVFNVDLGAFHDQHIESDGSIRMKAVTSIQRSDFGMDAFPSLAEDRVDLSVELVAERYCNEPTQPEEPALPHRVQQVHHPLNLSGNDFWQ